MFHVKSSTLANSVNTIAKSFRNDMGRNWTSNTLPSHGVRRIAVRVSMDTEGLTINAGPTSISWNLWLVTIFPHEITPVRQVEGAGSQTAKSDLSGEQLQFRRAIQDYDRAISRRRHR